MRYFELSFEMSPYNEAAADVLAALLADGGCDTFEPTASGLKAYALQDTYDEASIQGAIATTTTTFADESLSITYTCTEAPDENWNATWEAEHHFEPIALPDGQQLQIIPRQAFGSGEHATTRMILGLLAELPLAHTTVIDAGCGTGILGIAALKRLTKSFIPGLVFAVLLGIRGIHSIVTGGSWGFISILVAWMIWREGWREYQMALAEESFARWSQDDFDARVSPPPYDR